MGESTQSDPPGRSLLYYLEWRASNTPDAPCFLQPNSDFSEIKSYSYSQVFQIVNNLAVWLEKNIGESKPLATLAFLGVADPRYVFVPLAARRADFTALYLGLQNSFDANLHLCDETNARAVLYVDGVDKSVLPTNENRPGVCIPEIDDILNMESSYDDLPDVDHERGTFLLLHSSGSTGMPKPIEIASECLSVALTRSELDECDGYAPIEKVMGESTLMYFGIPIYHMAGFVVGTKSAFYLGTSVLYMPKDRTPSLKLILEAMEKTDIDSVHCAPGIFDELINDKDALEQFKKLKFVASGGGILPKDACTAINEYVKIIAIFGSTEITDLAPVIHDKAREEWEYFHISPKYNNIEWRPPEDGSGYELVLKRDPAIDHLQGVFYNFPGYDEFATGDLFTPHPSKQNYWRYESRADDQISFTNASTLNPLPIENLLTKDDSIQHAMIVGNARPFPILVIQPSEDAFEKFGSQGDDELRKNIWEVVKKANKHARANGQIAKPEHIILTDRDNPLIITAKTTVSKKASLNQYGDQVEEVYNNAKDDDFRNLSKRIDE